MTKLELRVVLNQVIESMMRDFIESVAGRDFQFETEDPVAAAVVTMSTVVEAFQTFEDNGMRATRVLDFKIGEKGILVEFMIASDHKLHVEVAMTLNGVRTYERVPRFFEGHEAHDAIDLFLMHKSALERNMNFDDVQLESLLKKE